MNQCAHYHVFGLFVSVPCAAVFYDVALFVYELERVVHLRKGCRAS